MTYEELQAQHDNLNIIEMDLSEVKDLKGLYFNENIAIEKEKEIRMKKSIKIISIFFILLLIIIKNISFAIEGNNDTIKEQQEEFEIEEFIEESKKYAGEFFEGIDLEELINTAIDGKINNKEIFNRILELFRK